MAWKGHCLSDIIAVSIPTVNYIHYLGWYETRVTDAFEFGHQPNVLAHRLPHCAYLPRIELDQFH